MLVSQASENHLGFTCDTRYMRPKLKKMYLDCTCAAHTKNTALQGGETPSLTSQLWYLSRTLTVLV